MKSVETKKSNKAFTIVLISIVVLAIGFIAWLVWYINADPEVELCDYKNLSVNVDDAEIATGSTALMGGMGVSTTVEEKINQAVLNALIENSDFKYLKKVVDERYEQFLAYYQQMAGLYDYASVEDLATQYYGYESYDAFDEDVKEYSEIAIKQELVLSAIAEIEGFTVTDEIFNEYITKYLAAYDYGEDEVETFLNDYGRADVYDVILNDYTLDKVVEWTGL